MSTTPEEHKSDAPTSIRCAVVTVSDTRTLETDTGGRTLIEHLEVAGHQVVLRKIIPDQSQPMRALLDHCRESEEIDAVLMTGGTGVTARDQTFETVTSYLTKTLPGYGELFRLLSYEEIGAAAMLSRATGGLMDRTIVLTMPGSRAAVLLAMKKLVIPELSHLVREARR
ncbi:MAG: molybdenum cofactor biosynthesis protein MoaB [Pirellulaceae bacterium]|nr:molybdenum cofactor biosynthesis protein MoaB [Pirellulaceae bacterium]